MVNNGEVPCHLDNNGSRKFLGTFVPEDTAVHVVRVFFNDIEVPGQLQHRCVILIVIKPLYTEAINHSLSA